MDHRQQLIDAMAAFERCEKPTLEPNVCWAALTGLGSKYLAVGSPENIGLIDCGEAKSWIVLCHEILFGPMQVKLAGTMKQPFYPEPLACSVEEAFASDIVCAPWSLAFDPAWIAEATHLNLRSSGTAPSAGAQTVFASASVTVQRNPKNPLQRRHGSLDEVIRGQVSGRMADELTILLHE